MVRDGILQFSDRDKSCSSHLVGTMDQVIAKKDATGIDDDMELDDEPLKDSLEDSLKESNVTEL